MRLVLFPSSDGARIGRGRTEHASPSSPPGEAQTGSGRTESEPLPQPLDIKFINSMRFRKVARNSETAVLRYHIAGSRSYIIASAELDAPPSSAPSDSPPPEPPPDDHMAHIPEKYHAFAHVFSPTEVEQLPPHRPGFDAAIETEDGKSPVQSERVNIQMWLNAYCNDCFPMYQGEISALLNLGRSLGGFGVAYFQVDWVTRHGALQAFGAEAGIVAALFVFVVPVLQIKGQWLRARFSL
ncbi:hypothetical protein OH76DRAFT_1485391 [Lentinus brumalis]|uniref:Uncharacterized protein n=1 Tax=Lentinus brumalis TaxID=2498619 RepID=A0A371D2D0_9APHY|nr:hypothetical protein OH76DRAFT_1485391 [Polyporus brumalis]